MTTVYANTIEGLHGSWGSGIATLVFKEGTQVYADNGPLVRALDSCFGNAIGEGHRINQRGIRGKKIAWSYDEFGLTLGGFTPLSDWNANHPDHKLKVGQSVEIEPPSDEDDDYEDAE